MSLVKQSHLLPEIIINIITKKTTNETKDAVQTKNKSKRPLENQKEKKKLSILYHKNTDTLDILRLTMHTPT